MNVSYVCRQCERPQRAELTAAAGQLVCSECHAVTNLAAEDVPAVASQADAGTGASLSGCIVCGCRELFVRKDFSQRLGVSIVVVGLLFSTVAWGFHWRYLSYAILFATALCDVVLYVLVGNMLQCYRCQAEYRGLSGLEQFEPFNLETHERFRQQALRLAQAKKA